MRHVKFRELRRALQSAAWEFERYTSNGHELWRSPAGFRVSVSNKDSPDPRTVKNQLAGIRRVGPDGEAVWQALGLTAADMTDEEPAVQPEPETTTEPEVKPLVLSDAGGTRRMQVRILHALTTVEGGKFEDASGRSTGLLVDWLNEKYAPQVWGSKIVNAALQMLDEDGFIARRMNERRTFRIEITDRGLEMASLLSQGDPAWPAFSVAKPAPAPAPEPVVVAPKPIGPDRTQEQLDNMNRRLSTALARMEQTLKPVDRLEAGVTHLEAEMLEVDGRISALEGKLTDAPAGTSAPWVDGRLAAVEAILRQADSATEAVRPHLVNAAVAMLKEMA